MFFPPQRIDLGNTTAFIGKIRSLAKIVAESYVKQREELGYPLLKAGEINE